MKKGEVWVLICLSPYSETLMGIFATKELAEEFREEDEDSCLLYTIRKYEVQQ